MTPDAGVDESPGPHSHRSVPELPATATNPSNLDVAVAHWRVRGVGGAVRVAAAIVETFDCDRVFTVDPPGETLGGSDVAFHDVLEDLRLTPVQRAKARVDRVFEYDIWEDVDWRAYGDWRLTVGGDGPLREALERRAREFGVTDRVTFLGYVPEDALPARYAASDLFVLPSAYEGMPLTVLEALASGTPVVASPRAAADVVSDAVGRVVEPGPAVLARTIDALATQPGTVAGLSQTARERALAYDWSQVAADYESLFADLLE